MADDSSPKPAIPAWQQAQNPTPESQPSESSAVPNTEGRDPADDTKDEPVSDATAEPTSEQLVEQMRAFLTDEAIKAAPAEKVRAFFESKNIHKDLIDQVIPPSNGAAQISLNPSDFASFKNEEVQMRKKIVNVPTGQLQNNTNASAPPIITYPEFLIEAHTPAPLVTFGRLLNTIYVAGSLATLTYAANQFLLKPMTASLTESRHDFASHSQDKLNEFNERLSKIVSQVPEAARSNTESSISKATGNDTDDTESVNSDPTELFHRDMGTQTSPSHSRSPSVDSFGIPQQEQRSTIEEQEGRIKSLHTLLDTLATATEKKANEEQRKESMDDLRHYLDTMMYSSPGINLWAQTDYKPHKKPNGGAPKADKDVIDQVKADIRSIKSSLLSAKRFPSTVSSGGSAYGGRVGAS
ncbi:hypothetical protein K431DRAFT_215353 [Polychaeton citri CBS 116435]|uniref:Peroxisomal membrane protein PEX14 n=1 Tax=Polychaeton citri CBS 116435 TaxID=1314669 RepID=A0A9P4QE57_9PEZI|nr:hypothetical protein K431DRAFT_215353 [Polychaeton citri CBS 116435]